MGRKVRLPELLCCPNCGYDLDKARPIRIGELYADPIGETYWKGQLVTLTTNQRILLAGMLMSAKHNNFATKSFLADRADCSLKSVDVQIMHMRRAFQAVDPGFNHIETKFGDGYKWTEKPSAPKTMIAKMPSIPIILYSNGEVTWQGKHRIFLSARQLQLLKMFVDANGGYLRSKDIWQPLGLANHGAIGSLVNALRQKFWEADERSQIIHQWNGKGYAICKPDYKQPAVQEPIFSNELFTLYELEMDWNGNRIHLSARETQLLSLLGNAGDRWVPNEEIYRRLNLENGYMTLKSLIHRGINKKLHQIDPSAEIIELKRGHGYRLVEPPIQYALAA